MRIGRRAFLAGGLALIGACPAGAAALRVPDLYDAPRAIVTRLLEAYAAGNPPAPAQLPFVHRLKVAMTRADLAVDPVLGSEEGAISALTVGPARLSESRRGSVEARFTQAGKPRRLIFDLDSASGDWLITEIRYDDGRSLRQLLQIERPAAP